MSTQVIFTIGMITILVLVVGGFFTMAYLNKSKNQEREMQMSKSEINQQKNKSLGVILAIVGIAIFITAYFFFAMAPGGLFGVIGDLIS